MKVKGCIHLLLIFLIFQFRTSAQSGRSYKELYRQAERLYYSSSSTDRTDSIALSTYLEVISRHDNRPDSLLMDAHFKAGIYLQTAGKFAAAIPYFRKTLQIFEKAGGLEDSLQFLPNLFLGNSYYTGDQLDSAFFYFKKAEVIAAEYSHIAGLERLYNTLGVIYFESGDYHQSTIYFDKALATLRDQNSGNAFLEVNYQSNFASSMRKLGQREKAMQIYQGLLKFHINEDEILHNIGSMYLEQGRDSLAIQYLRKVSYNNAAKANDLALAWFHLGNNTEAKSQLRKAEVLSKRKNGELKSVQLGLSHKLLGDIMLHEGNYDSSLIYYQSALNQLIFSFNSTNYREDPAEFSGQYYVMELFETLVAKA
ncbi:MAG TPA: tetratricopeptide repeat protein, partial [Flavitalea sp.]|nr:tetratricopeptide repeat protein [Flavitalea sp.]